MRNRSSILLLLTAALLVWSGPAPAAPLGRGFTYQGQLTESAVPVEGTVTLRFSLWDAAGSGDPPTGGSMVGTAQTVTNVLVAGGIFSVTVNASNEFGTSAFNGEARWLQVEVCGDTSCTTTTVLGPRQPITGAPYALGPWLPGDTSISYTPGNVGIGTAAPVYRLDVRGGPMAVEGLGDQADLLWLNTERNWVFRQEGAGAAAALKLESVGGGGNKNFMIQTSGGVGIGTATPLAKLEVRGDIRLGAVGQYLAAGGTENLRIIRGKVSAAGAVAFGSGFSAARTSTGVYSVTYSTQFPIGQWPVVTASAESNGTVARFAMINTPTHASVVIRTVNGSGTAVDCDFYFIVAGTK